MLLFYIILIPLFIASLWLFFKTSPKQINSKSIKIYNLGAITLAIFLSFIYTFTLRASMINGSDFGWWPVLSFIFSLIISISVLFVAGIIRNFIIFRNKTR